jgi:membrane-bound metal-dependent hydrolase YbcI (DUF457 family)
VSWAAHEFEDYFIQKHVGTKASFVAVCIGALLPDLFTKAFVYNHKGNVAHFHRGWPGVGPTHSLIFGFVLAVLVLGLTKSRSWALGILIGQWAHVFTDISDTAGVMPFFPFSTQNISISMWKHAAFEGRFGDAAAYYSGLGGIWDFFWFVVVIVFARNTLRADYFWQVVVPADLKVWSWFRRRLYLSDNGLLVLYRSYFLYGAGRMVSWFLYARFDVKVPWQPVWGGPNYIKGTHLMTQSWQHILISTSVGFVLFCAFLYLCWITFIRRLWRRGADPEIVERGSGLRAAFH